MASMFGPPRPAAVAPPEPPKSRRGLGNFRTLGFSGSTRRTSGRGLLGRARTQRKTLLGG